MKRLILGFALVLAAVSGAVVGSDPVEAQTSYPYRPVPSYQPWRGSPYSGTYIGQYYPPLYYQNVCSGGDRDRSTCLKGIDSALAESATSYRTHAQVFSPKLCKEEQVMRLFVGVLALAVAASTQAMAFGPQRDARMIRYKPDPYWTPCDYSLGPQYPQGCGE